MAKIWPVLIRVWTWLACLNPSIGKDLNCLDPILGHYLAGLNTSRSHNLASLSASLGQDLVDLNPSFFQDLVCLNSTLGRLKIGWKRPRATFLKRNVTSNKNKKTKCDFDYIKTKQKLNKALAKIMTKDLLSLNCCVGEKRLSKSYLVGNLRRKRYKKKFFSVNNNICLDQPKRSISFLSNRTSPAKSITVLGKSNEMSRYQD